MLYRSIGSVKKNRPSKRTLGQFLYLRPTVTDLHPTNCEYIRYLEICQSRNEDWWQMRTFTGILFEQYQAISVDSR